MKRRRSILLGALAGAVGTQTLLEWEFAAATATWEDVSAPGQVGHLALRRLTGGDVPDRWARTTQNLVHWATGVAWGAQFGAFAAHRRPRWWWGFGHGVSAWGTSNVTLPLAGVYRPIWDYEADTLGKDLRAHLLYGAAAGATYAAARRVRPEPTTKKAP